MPNTLTSALEKEADKWNCCLIKSPKLTPRCHHHVVTVTSAGTGMLSTVVLPSRRSTLPYRRHRGRSPRIRSPAVGLLATPRCHHHAVTIASAGTSMVSTIVLPSQRLPSPIGGTGEGVRRYVALLPAYPRPNRVHLTHACVEEHPPVPNARLLDPAKGTPMFMQPHGTQGEVMLGVALGMCGPLWMFCQAL